MNQCFFLFFFEKQPEVVVPDFDLFTEALVPYFKLLMIPRDNMSLTKILFIKTSKT